MYYWIRREILENVLRMSFSGSSCRKEAKKKTVGVGGGYSKLKEQNKQREYGGKCWVHFPNRE